MNRFASRCHSLPRTSSALLSLSALTIGALLASTGAASAAQPSAGGLQTTVYYNLSDLATERGALEVYRRIASAAMEVCPGYDSRRAEVVAASKACQRQAIAGAIGRIGNPRLAAVHARALPRHG